jgi:hypothetical protein
MPGGEIMAGQAENGRRGGRWRVVGWGTLGALLLLPAVAMQFTNEVTWDETDFIVMGAMLVGVGLGAEFLARRSGSIAYRLGSAAALLTAFLTLWVNLAVGMIGSEDNPYNLLFAGVVAVALAGALLARFRPAGMALAMTAAAAAQALGAAGGLPSDVRGGIFSLVFAGLWLLSAGLFRKAAQDQAPGRGAMAG